MYKIKLLKQSSGTLVKLSLNICTGLNTLANSVQSLTLPLLFVCKS